MMESAPNRRFLGYKWLRLLALAVAVMLIYLASICLHILQQGSQQEIHPADAIVVFGAAEYAGRPSPVYRARLDHAFELFKRGIAPVVITSGGAAADPNFSEGGVGHDYLKRRGIPDSSLIAETKGSDTAESAKRVGVILRANHMSSCIAVSDEYDVFRVRRLLDEERVRVYVAPRPESKPHSLWLRAWAVLREAISYLAWRLHFRVR